MPKTDSPTPKDTAGHTAQAVDPTTICSPFVWTGDLADDCWCEHGPFFSHVEMMVDAVEIDDDDDKWKTEIWWFSVRKNGQEIFNSSDHKGTILGGDMCRALAEVIMANVLDQATANPSPQ